MYINAKGNHKCSVKGPIVSLTRLLPTLIYRHIHPTMAPTRKRMFKDFKSIFFGNKNLQNRWMSDKEIACIMEQKNRGDSELLGLSFEAVNRAIGQFSFKNNRYPFQENNVTLFTINTGLKFTYRADNKSNSTTLPKVLILTVCQTLLTLSIGKEF